MPGSTRCQVFMEPVQRTVGHIELDGDGAVADMDQAAEAILQHRLGDCVGENVLR